MNKQTKLILGIGIAGLAVYFLVRKNKKGSEYNSDIPPYSYYIIPKGTIIENASIKMSGVSFMDSIKSPYDSGGRSIRRDESYIGQGGVIIEQEPAYKILEITQEGEPTQIYDEITKRMIPAPYAKKVSQDGFQFWNNGAKGTVILLRDAEVSYKNKPIIYT